jgi:L-2-hydroxyglutarate oxidase LhgO
MTSDFAIVGAGIVGLTVARELKALHPDASICVIEKESAPALHTSGRNSGVLHAGFYYAADSLKAKFTRDGNRMMKEFCREKVIAMNECGKLVVAKNEGEVEGLRELKRRGDRNGVETSLITAAEAKALEPNARTTEFALHSPATASVDPRQVCAAVVQELEAGGVRFLFDAPVTDYRNGKLVTPKEEIEAGFILNCAGLYADVVAEKFGAGRGYVMMPFKGVYLYWEREETPVKMHIYPVPNLANPFLGVHFTVTTDGHAKIGPTAIPAFWRENYRALENFRFGEAAQVMGYEARLFFTNSFGFRNLAFQEMRKYKKRNLIADAALMVEKVDPAGFTKWGQPAIRAQLMNRKTLKLEQDFVLERTERSLHVLNAVSPAFTCSFPIAKHVVGMVEAMI